MLALTAAPQLRRQRGRPPAISTAGIDATRAADWLMRYAMNTPAQAAQRVKFFDTYRSYVINYNLGEDLVKAYVERQRPATTRRRGGRSSASCCRRRGCRRG